MKRLDACFDQTYRMGGRRQGAQLDIDRLVQCVNSRAGEEYFSVNGEEG